MVVSHLSERYPAPCCPILLSKSKYSAPADPSRDAEDAADRKEVPRLERLQAQHPSRPGGQEVPRLEKIDILYLFSPPPRLETVTTDTYLIRLWDCPPPSLAQSALDDWIACPDNGGT